MFRYIGDKLFYTKPIRHKRNGRRIMILRALKLMGVYYYYEE